MSDSASTSSSSGRDRIPPKRREEALERDAYTCRGCGDVGEEAGGSVELQVHHAEPDPDDRDRHALSNLTTYCVDCHVWQHLQPDGDEVPFEITAADDDVLDPADYEILQFLVEHGPAGTSEIADALSAELTATAVRERLSVLMGLDNLVEERDRQLVDQDVETKEWGLTDQIERSARGHIPSDRQKLIQRVEDEQVRRALDRGCDRQAVMDVLDISRRSTFHKEKRARAYNLPLTVLRRSGDGGQHPGGSTSSDESNETDKQSTRVESDDQQQGPYDKDAGEGEQVGSEAVAEIDRGTPLASDVSGDDDGPAVREQLQMVITALQQVNAEL